MTAALEPGWIRVYSRITPEGEDLYELNAESRQKVQQLATWERPATVGSTAANPEEIISGWAQDDWSGGFGIEDADEGVDTARYRFGVIDARSPHQICLPPKTYRPTKPSGASGSALPLGDVGTQMYVAWGSHAWGYDEATDAFHSTDNNLTKTPVDHGTQFAGKLWIPAGANGGTVLTELTAATGTLTMSQISSATITPVRFGLWDNKLFAIDTANKLWQHTVATATSAPTTGWTIVENALGDDCLLDTSHTPKRLLSYYNRAGESTLWCITNKGAFMFNWDESTWIQATLEFGPHPEFGRDAHVWRGGEDLWVAGGGLDALRYTGADVSVPLSGMSKDQGVPPSYSGTIYSMAAERSTLYFLVKGLPTLASSEWAEDDPANPYFSASAVPIWLGAWTGTAFMALFEDTESSGDPTWLKLSTVAGGYRLWWGSTVGDIYNQIIPLDFYNPRAKLALGRDEFESSGWFETIRYDANMVGWDKLASHAFALMDYASVTEELLVSYRTDADLYELSGTNSVNEPSYTPWKRVQARGRSLLWFDDDEVDPKSGLPWREGLNFQWVQFRFDFAQGSNTRLSPIMAAFSMHHVRIPQDAASLTLQVKVPQEEFVDISRPPDSYLRLRNMQRQGAYLHLQLDDEMFLRGKLAGVSLDRFMGGSPGRMDGLITLIFVEIGASSNAHQTEAIDA